MKRVEKDQAPFRLRIRIKPVRVGPKMRVHIRIHNPARDVSHYFLANYPSIGSLSRKRTWYLKSEHHLVEVMPLLQPIVEFLADFSFALFRHNGNGLIKDRKDFLGLIKGAPQATTTNTQILWGRTPYRNGHENIVQYDSLPLKPKTQPAIRAATKDDYNSIVALYLNSMANGWEKILIKNHSSIFWRFINALWEHIDGPNFATLTKDYLDKPEKNGLLRGLLIAEVSGQLVAMLSFEQQSSSKIWVHDLVTQPAYRRQGIATLLLSDLIAKVRKSLPAVEEIYFLAKPGNPSGAMAVEKFNAKKERTLRGLDRFEISLIRHEKPQSQRVIQPLTRKPMWPIESRGA